MVGSRALLPSWLLLLLGGTAAQLDATGGANVIELRQRGKALYRAGDFRGSAELFQGWLPTIPSPHEYLFLFRFCIVLYSRGRCGPE